MNDINDETLKTLDKIQDSFDIINAIIDDANRHDSTLAKADVATIQQEIDKVNSNLVYYYSLNKSLNNGNK